jgi:HSP20 family protein
MAGADPFRELERARRELERAFGDAGAAAPGGPPAGRAWRRAFLPGRAARLYPLVNLYDDGETFTVEALAPGVDPAGLDVTVAGSTLTLAGEKPGPTGVPPERVHRSERAAGRFVRTVELPAEVDPDGVRARYQHGLLLVTVPRAASARPRRVTVQAG